MSQNGRIFSIHFLCFPRSKDLVQNGRFFYSIHFHCLSRRRDLVQSSSSQRNLLPSPTLSGRPSTSPRIRCLPTLSTATARILNRKSCDTCEKSRGNTRSGSSWRRGSWVSLTTCLSNMAALVTWGKEGCWSVLSPRWTAVCKATFHSKWLC